VIVGTIVASLFLRMALVQAGGQFYWPDEDRYLGARAAVEELARGEYRKAFELLDSGDHPLFRVVALIPAFVEHLSEREDTRVPATFFGLFSALNIGLLWALARRLGAGDWEAALVAVAAATSNVLAYWARHISPYDLSMTLVLAGLLFGTAMRPVRGAIACGVFAALGFLAYAGYWTLAGAAILVHAATAPERLEGVRRALIAGTAAATTIAAVIGGNAVFGGHLFARSVSFSRTVTQGVHAEGWSLPFEYLWEAERLLVVVWLAAAAAAAGRALQGRATPRERAGLIGLVFVYGALVVTSVLLHRFVVYGRLARQLVPFFCLLTASALETLRRSETRRARAAFVVLIAGLVVQALVNFAGPLSQSFPLDFSRDLSWRGNWGIRRRHGIVVAVNATNTHPLPDPVAVPRRYVTLKEAPHPREYRPYQYEGSTPAERRLIRSTDIRMRLLLSLPDRDP
jgi:hypothetical protein